MHFTRPRRDHGTRRQLALWGSCSTGSTLLESPVLLVHRANAALRRPAPAAIALWSAGTAAVLSAIPLEHWHGRTLAEVVSTVPIAGLAIGTLLWRRKHLSAGVLHATTALATATITYLVALVPGPNFGLLYIYVAIFAALFYSAKGFVCHLVTIAVADAAALALQPPAGGPFVAWGAIVGTATVASLILRSLVVELRLLSKQDPLTQLANRRAWEEHLRIEMARTQRTGLALAVAVLDLDGFKAVNDSQGHQAGDRLLQTMAAAWRPLLRQSGDLLARLGGDEFGIVSVATSPVGIQMVIERLRLVAGADGITFAVGMATWDGLESAELLVSRADAAMFRDKEDHRQPPRRQGAEPPKLDPYPDGPPNRGAQANVPGCQPQWR